MQLCTSHSSIMLPGGISLVITTSLSPTAPWVGHYWEGILEVAIITSTNASPLTLVHLVWFGLLLRNTSKCECSATVSFIDNSRILNYVKSSWYHHHHHQYHHTHANSGKELNGGLEWMQNRWLQVLAIKAQKQVKGCCIIVWYAMVGNGMVCYGMLRYSMVWYGMVCYGQRVVGEQQNKVR